MLPDVSRYARAIESFDAANAQDPNMIIVNGVARPRELVQAERLSSWVERLAPDASEALRLAARCQHIERWTLPRDRFPEGRTGYLKWRTELGRFHADRATRILTSLGYDAALIEAVRRINLKQGLRSNPDTQLMEDALCLSFLEFEFAAFAAKHPADKVREIVWKTWKKMSPAAHAQAVELSLPEAALALIHGALAGEAAAESAQRPESEAEAG